MKNSEYWAERFKALEDSNHKKAALTAKQIEDIYKSAEKELQTKVAVWYARLAVNNDISILEAKRLMKGQELEEFKWDVEQYIIAMHENEYDPKWVKQLENASARFHISKYEGLRIRLKHYAELVAAKQQNLITDYLKDMYTEDYYKTAYEIQTGFNTGFELSAINENQLDNVLKRPWATDGKNFSDRIWNNKEKLFQQLDTEITRNLMLGYNPSKSAEAIAKNFKTSVHNATTLVYTETAAISSMATESCFKDLNVEKYEILATLDSSTSAICQEMDGKVFDMKDFRVGVTASPFHPRCRSVETPFFDDEYSDLFNDGAVRAARNPETGKTEYVPADITYKEWKKRFVDNDQFTSESNGGIIKSGGGLYRKVGGFEVGEPMPSEQFSRIQKAAERKGILLLADEESEKYVLSRNAEGITLNENTVCFVRNPSRVAVFEELIHTAQFRNGEIDGSALSIARAEVKAKTKLLKNAKAYKLTDYEIESTKRLLENDKKMYESLLEVK